jgi:predicted RNase H-like HicB family nuclease
MTMRQVIVFRGEDGYWVAEVPSLPGCISQGRSKEEAVANATDAAELWIEVAEELGQPIPTDAGGAEVFELRRKVG